MLEFFTIVTVVITLILIVVIVLMAKKNRSTFWYIFTLVMFMMWSSLNYFSRIILDENIALYLVRIIMFCTVLLMLGIINFIDYFPYGVRTTKKSSLPINIIYVLIALATLSNKIIKTVEFDTLGVVPIFGDFIFAYAAILVFTLIFVFVISYKKYAKGDNQLKNQIIYISIGILVTGIAGIITNFLFLILLKSSNFIAFGPTFTLILISFTTYAIVKHRLFEVRIFFGRLTYYLLTGILPYSLYYGVILLNIAIFGGVFKIGSIISNTAVAIIFVIIYNSWNRLISERIETNIINPGYNPDKVITKLNRELGSTLDPLILIKATANTINQTIRPNHVGIYIKAVDEEPISFQQNKSLSLPLESVYDVWKKKIGSTIFLTKFDRYEQNEILNKLFEEGVSAIISIKPSDGEPIGVIVIGSNNNLGRFSSSEIEFITSISNSLNVAISRSLLYEEVKQFNKTLQQKVDDATAELQLKNDQLDTALRKEKDMMDVIGHELRTPLGTARNAIMMIDTFKSDGKLTDELYKKYMKIAIDNIRREKDLLQTILQSARLENDRLQISKAKFDARLLLESTSNSFKEQAKGKHLEFEVAQLKEPVEIYNDQIVLQQIVDNFVSNAIKYTFKGKVTVMLKDLGKSIRISVKDTGEGLKKEDLKFIGKKFFRANTHLDSSGVINGERIIRPGGTGIGLYVVKGILKNLGSELEVESEFGKGSTFSFELKKDLDLVGKETNKPVVAAEPVDNLTNESIVDINKKSIEVQQAQAKEKAKKLNTTL